MAVVYRGYDLLLRRQVAVKVLRPQFAADDEFVQRFYQEAQAAAKLSHPN
ncbi:MAG: serine/threonine protein kinase, partial [Candidatus Eremiobacterales bacterium]